MIRVLSLMAALCCLVAACGGQTPLHEPIPVRVDIFHPLPETSVGFEEQPVKIGAQVSNANDKPVTGAQIEAVITLPSGELCAKGTLKEASEGVYRGEVCPLGQDAPPGTYTVTVTVSGSYQGQQVHAFVVHPPQTVEMHGFRVRIPTSYEIGTRGKQYAESQGDVSVELTSSGANSVLVYRKAGRLPLEVEPLTRLLTDINVGSYEMGTVVESSEPTEFDGKPALQLGGYWTHDTFGKGPFRAVGVQCGEYFFVVEAAINGAWTPDLTHIMNSFHCLEK
jgi:hypothetical protein